MPTEIVEADVQHAYIVGLAQGEIRGRLGLARELEAAFGPQAGQELTPEMASRIRVSQVH